MLYPEFLLRYNLHVIEDGALPVAAPPRVWRCLLGLPFPVSGRTEELASGLGWRAWPEGSGGCSRTGSKPRGLWVLADVSGPHPGPHSCFVSPLPV